MSRVKIFPKQNYQEVFSINKAKCKNKNFNGRLKCRLTFKLLF